MKNKDDPWTVRIFFLRLRTLYSQQVDGGVPVLDMGNVPSFLTAVHHCRLEAVGQQSWPVLAQVCSLGGGGLDDELVGMGITECTLFLGFGSGGGNSICARDLCLDIIYFLKQSKYSLALIESISFPLSMIDFTKEAWSDMGNAFLMISRFTLQAIVL